jgi:hypothetical protein
MGRPRLKDKRVCYACGSDTTYLKSNGAYDWTTNKPTDLFLCKRCVNEYVWNPKWKPIHNIRLVTFRQRRILMKENPRTGVCSLCGKKIGDEYIGSKRRKRVVKTTQMHHLANHKDDPLKDTIEVCVSCHMKESYRLGQLDPNHPNKNLSGLLMRWKKKRDTVA